MCFVFWGGLVLRVDEWSGVEWMGMGVAVVARGARPGGRTDGAVAEVGVAGLGHGVEVSVDDLVEILHHHLLLSGGLVCLVWSVREDGI